MKKVFLILAAAAAAAVLVGALGAATETRRSPALRLVDRQPLTLKGLRFRTREVVRLKVTTDRGTATRRVRATANGAFQSQFALPLDRCSGLYAVAVGSRGSRTTLKLPEPLCPPSL